MLFRELFSIEITVSVFRLVGEASFLFPTGIELLPRRIKIDPAEIVWIPFLKDEILVFGFIVTSPTTLPFGKFGNGTFSYWILGGFSRKAFTRFWIRLSSKKSSPTIVSS